jgi:hypothetical protein
MEKIIEKIKEVIKLLVEKRYSEVEEIINKNRLTRFEIEEAIKIYGKELVLLPESEYEKLNIIQIDNKFEKEFSIRFNLWTIEEGRSDLSIELSVVDRINKIEIRLENIIVF